MTYVDNPFKSPAVLSVCTGMRGLERGIERVVGPVNTVAYVEIEAFVIENLVRQMEQGVLAPAPVWSDIKTFPWEAFYGKLHWIIGGYPCQPFSHAGLRNGAADPRHLYPFISRGIKKSRPVGCFFENVEGHLSLGLRDVCKDLRKMGYQVEAGLFSAAETGAPHRRNRVFILAMENSYLLRMRRCNLERYSRGIEIQTSRPCTMANAGYSRYGYVAKNGTAFKQTQGPEELLPSGKLGNTAGFDAGTRAGQNDKVESGRSGDVGHADISRLEGWQCGECKECSGEWVTRQDGTQRWPSNPGEQQYEWEPPRVESSMGYVLNGYNFREDLLRMAGNAVVEQQAELAFRTLLGKFQL